MEQKIFFLRKEFFMELIQGNDSHAFDLVNEVLNNKKVTAYFEKDDFFFELNDCLYKFSEKQLKAFIYNTYLKLEKDFKNSVVDLEEKKQKSQFLSYISQKLDRSIHNNVDFIVATMTSLSSDAIKIISTSVPFEKELVIYDKNKNRWLLNTFEESPVMKNSDTQQPSPKYEKHVDLYLKLVDTLTDGNVRSKKFLLQWTKETISEKKDGVECIILLNCNGGTGKSAYASIIKHILGSSLSVTLDNDKLEEKYNSYSEGRAFLEVSEFKNKNDFKNKIKSMTDNTLLIRKMYSDSFEIDNYNKLLFTTNNVDCWAGVKNERRYCLIAGEHALDEGYSNLLKRFHPKIIEELKEVSIREGFYKEDFITDIAIYLKNTSFYDGGRKIRDLDVETEFPNYLLDEVEEDSQFTGNELLREFIETLTPGRYDLIKLNLKWSRYANLSNIKVKRLSHYFKKVEGDFWEWKRHTDNKRYLDVLSLSDSAEPTVTTEEPL